ncbi:MAG: DUF6310 domain-containing protein [Hyalangium sp.]|uniref:DUF6310 domain-containing protein n=1 Tax=Hyalangium sp. TaxID=2028555 RepID=UPI00389A25F0
MARNPRLVNLQRAATLPWRDEGQCVVHEASHPWPVVVERCFHALDSKRIRFRDTERRCSVASADAATLETMVGICLLTQPELVVGAVVIIGTVVVAVAIAEALDDYARRPRGNTEAEASSGRAAPVTAATSDEPQADRRPEPDGSSSGRDWLPPQSPDPSDRGPECTPRRVPPKGGHPFHDTCADNVPLNAFRGANALVNGKAFDALQPAASMLWEVKTDNFDTYPPDLRDIVIRKQVREFRRERELARACGFGFRVGVRSAAHKAALEAQDSTLDIIVMDWC